MNLALLLCWLVSTVSSAPSPIGRSCSNSTLVMAQVIWRHGARNIQFIYPNDPWKSRKYWPEGYGQLTNQGKKQQYELGKWLRKRYQATLFPKGYSVDNVYVRSTDIDRSIMSAQANMAGLFPPTEKQEWINHLNWQPIPVHAESMDITLHLTPIENPCPLHTHLLKKYLASFYPKYAQVLSYASVHSGIYNITLEDASGLYDTLSIEKTFDRKSPEWTKSIYSQLGEIRHFLYKSLTGTPGMARIYGGFLLKELLDKFTNKTQATLSPDRTIFMYSAHDITIVNILNSLEMFNNFDLPPFASCVLFELHHSNGEFYIQILYRETPERIIGPMYIPNCGTKCPLEQFRKIYEKIIPTRDFDTECILKR